MVNPAQQLLADAQIRIAELLRASPAADLERNLKALLAQTFQRLELVTREEPPGATGDAGAAPAGSRPGRRGNGRSGHGVGQRGSGASPGRIHPRAIHP
jgi:hypothetical protein